MVTVVKYEYYFWNMIVLFVRKLTAESSPKSIEIIED